ncbi:MAG: zf-TFIIB domain-containing protein [Proteobacteria bacterium]|nr:zf-TFIIB domain-containing protein [Pseudomonadota bacterium]
MQCPKCLSDMEVIDYKGIEIDRCTECFGMWFDHLEREDLKSLEGADEIDIGDEFVGARYNEILDVPCPKCKVKMDHVLHTEPFEIKFESCPQCHGAYFDAGEFKDYMEDEIFEQFQDIVRHIQ